MREPDGVASRRILSTSHGSNRQAFTSGEWALFLSIGAIWGSSFLFIAEALGSFEPGLITWLRVSFGAATLWLFRGARRKVARQDMPRVLALSVLWVAIRSRCSLWLSSTCRPPAGMLNGRTRIAGRDRKT
jgi:hypothetical protein